MTGETEDEKEEEVEEEDEEEGRGEAGRDGGGVRDTLWRAERELLLLLLLLIILISVSDGLMSFVGIIVSFLGEVLVGGNTGLTNKSLIINTQKKKQ